MIIIAYYLVVVSWIITGYYAFVSWNKKIMPGQSLMALGLSSFCIVAQLEWITSGRGYTNGGGLVAISWELWIALTGILLARIFRNCVKCHTARNFK